MASFIFVFHVEAIGYRKANANKKDQDKKKDQDGEGEACSRPRKAQKKSSGAVEARMSEEGKAALKKFSMRLFNGYDLRGMGIPTDALPQPDRPHYGKHGYTVTSQNGAVPGSVISFNPKATCCF